QNIWNTLSDTVAQQQFYPLLLHGVTGSGKTEIYLRIMDQALKQGRQCLFLVPEIALTTQLWDRISSRLRVPIAMLHSSLTAAERFDAWRMIRRGDVNVVIGARSAIFASFKNLGAIVVDEEHDPSYKQDEKMRYHARDLALLKGKYAKCIVVLGSATPSFESYYNAHTGKYQLAHLRQRVDNRPLPRVDIIDMKLEKALQRKKGGILSRALTQEIKQRLAKEQQTLIFFNRRGFAPSYICQECGHAFTCPNCDVSLIHHHRQRKLCCHYCNHARPVPQECPACGSFFLISLGWGTERLEKEIAHLFPEARIARMDRDTTSHKGASRAILKQMADGSLDILIGTQMIVKGFHLPRVTLVGVISADQSLNFPDYRASERTFQLLTQVAGRAGRGSIEGEVIIQTYTPEHYSIACARQHDYEKFFKHEMKFRRELAYPPYTKMVNIRFDGTNQLQVTQLAQKAGACARTVLDRNNGADNIEILGPARAPWEKIKNRYRYQMLLKGTSTQTLHIFSQQILQMARNEIKNSDTRVSIDVDPVFVL
ncbi:MAG: primosomal protein N', partial [Deltaproteobacteria bacterium]|nr:primosomal protein N' [Deltaproteobacteria bacterium]